MNNAGKTKHKGSRLRQFCRHEAMPCTSLSKSFALLLLLLLLILLQLCPGACSSGARGGYLSVGR